MGKAYEDLKAAKEEEIAAGQEQIDAKTAELADTDEKNAQAKQDVIDTKASLSADEEFLSMLKEKCSMTDSEWEKRSKTRALEMEACSKALAFLTSDDAHDLFTRTFNPAFVQKSEIAEMQVQMKRAGEDREKENKEFQQTVADQRASQKLLQSSLSIL